MSLRAFCGLNILGSNRAEIRKNLYFLLSIPMFLKMKGKLVCNHFQRTSKTSFMISTGIRSMYTENSNPFKPSHTHTNWLIQSQVGFNLSHLHTGIVENFHGGLIFALFAVKKLIVNLRPSKILFCNKISGKAQQVVLLQRMPSTVLI